MQAHGCPICLKLKTDKVSLRRCLSQREVVADAAERVELEAKIVELQWDIRYAEFHQVRRDHQRQFSQTVRDGLSPGCQLWYIDYVSYYALSGRKQNVLVLVSLHVPEEGGGEVIRYNDYIANAPHDGYFTAEGLRVHFDRHVRPGDRIFIFGDNGMVCAPSLPPLPHSPRQHDLRSQWQVSGLMLMALSTLAVEYKAGVRLIPFAACVCE